jgi:RNA polymerase sigma-70 factor, ECF subfamily
MLSINCLLDIHDLVAGAQAGDPDAMQELLTVLRPAVLGYCRARLSTYAGGLDAADDVAQETCVAIFSVLPRYEQQGVPFAAWVYAIAANKVADAQRRFGRSPVPVENVPDQVEPEPTPEEQVMTAASTRLLSEVIDRLPERMREVLLMRAGGASADTIGQQLGMKPGNVRVLQHRAIAKLRTLIAESEEHHDLVVLPTSARSDQSSRAEPSLLSA